MIIGLLNFYQKHMIRPCVCRYSELFRKNTFNRTGEGWGIVGPQVNKFELVSSEMSLVRRGALEGSRV